MDSIKKQARVAGLLYLLGGITAPFCLIYVPGALMVAGDAAATADRVRASGNILRLGIASELFSTTMFIFVVLALYRLFKPVNERLALAMAAVFFVSIPVSLLNVVNNLAALFLVSRADFQSVFEKPQLDALVYLFLRLHAQGLLIASIFWGLWLFPFGMLVIRSGFIPRILGVFLFLAGTAYPITFLTSLFFHQHSSLVSRFTSVLEFGELPIILWLLVWGARPQRSATPAAVR